MISMARNSNESLVLQELIFNNFEKKHQVNPRSELKDNCWQRLKSFFEVHRKYQFKYKHSQIFIYSLNATLGFYLKSIYKKSGFRPEHCSNIVNSAVAYHFTNCDHVNYLLDQNNRYDNTNDSSNSSLM